MPKEVMLCLSFSHYLCPIKTQPVVTNNDIFPVPALLALEITVVFMIFVSLWTRDPEFEL